MNVEDCMVKAYDKFDSSSTSTKVAAGVVLAGAVVAGVVVLYRLLFK